jgi:CotS family spore coat protein
LFDYGLSTLEQYGLTASTSSRTRGALLCQTEKGLMILREFQGSEKKLQKQQELLQTLKEQGCLVDVFVENEEGSLVSRDKDEIAYTLQQWFEGKECDTKSREDLIKSVRTLARLHKVMKMTPDTAYMEKSLKEEYRRHNQEILKIRKFIRSKGASCGFEKDYLASVQWFLDRGRQALEMLEQSSYEELRQEALEGGFICHGEFNQHHVLMTRKGPAVTNFGHWRFDTQMADLYHFMRKILEKYNWDCRLARDLLTAYHRERPISRMEWENLRIRFIYPEKYWKLANYYFSHNKAWISEKNAEKLKNIIKQKEIWADFAEKCFGEYSL